MLPKNSLTIENQPFSQKVFHSKHEINNEIDILDNDTEGFIKDRNRKSTFF